MTEDVPRDEVVARALQGIPVPDYEPGFWEQLDARLAAEGFPGLSVSALDEPAEPTEPAEAATAPLALVAPGVEAAEVEAPTAPEPEPLTVAPVVELPAPAPVPAELAVAVPTARRRGLALLGAAAAVALAVLGMQLVGEEPETFNTAAPGDVESTLRAPGGGSTTEPDGGAVDDGDPEPDGATERSGSGSTTVPGDGQAGVAVPAPGTVAGDGRPTATSFAHRGTVVPSTSAQETFVSWAGAVARGDVDEVVALTGPRTKRYHEATGTSPEDATLAWHAAYAGWSTADAGGLQLLEATPSAGDRVVVVLLERPDSAAADGKARSAVPLVASGDGWLVEPEALDPGAGDARPLLGTTVPARSGPVPPDHVIELPAVAAGTYSLYLDRTATTTLPGSKVVDGVLRWDPPDRVMTPGRHVLVVVHVTDDTITTRTTTFEVAAD